MTTMIWKRYAPPLWDAHYARKFAWSLLMVAIAAIAHLSAVTFLDSKHPDPARPDDAILEVVPQNDTFITLSNIIIITQATLTIFALSRYQFRDAPRIIFILALMYFLRALAMSMTPLAQTAPPEETFGESSIISRYLFQGMFFSGHAGSAFIQAASMRDKNLKRLQYTLAVGQVISIIASHSHYSIDIFGALFVAYFLVTYDFKQLVPPAWREASWAPWASPA